MQRTLVSLLAAVALALSLGACQRPTPEEPKTAMADATRGAPSAEPNPLAAASTLPLLAPHFDRISNQNFAPAFDEGMRQHLAEIAVITGNPAPADFDNTIVAMERSGAMLDRVSRVFFSASGSNSNEEIRAIEADYAPKLAAHRDAIMLDPALFARVNAIHNQRDALGLDAESARLLARYQLMFVRAGANLDDAAKAQLTALNAEQSTLQTQFDNNVLKATRDAAVVVDAVEELSGLEPTTIEALAVAAKERGLDGKYLIEITNTTRQPILVALKDRALRERVWNASASRATSGEVDNRPIVARLAAVRAETATLLGYPNWAAYVLDDQMAKTPAAAEKLLTDLIPAVLAKAKAEAAAIQALIDAEKGGFEVAPWDWEHYAEQVRKARFDLDQGAVKPYFEFERVLKDGVFFTMERLYGITLTERSDLPVYHPDVRVFDVLDADGNQIGLFYADYYAREGKRGGAWMDSFVDQSGLMQTKPVVVNVMNIRKAPDGQPTLLSFDEVSTMFHEFGHALHGLFSTVRYPKLSGTNVPRDFVEFPSQFEEDWALNPTVLANYARHYQTGEPMPIDLVDKVIAARGFNQGFDTLEYIAAALLDLEWHRLSVERSTIDDVQAFELAALEKYGVDDAAVPPRYRTAYFSHVWSGGYSAGYYAYLWSEILAADAFAYMGTEGGLERANGDRFRDQILSRGGTREPMALYVDYRGQEPTVDALLLRRGLK